LWIDKFPLFRVSWCIFKMRKRNARYPFIHDSPTWSKGISSLVVVALLVIASVTVLWVFVYAGVPVRAPNSETTAPSGILGPPKSVVNTYQFSLALLNTSLVAQPDSTITAVFNITSPVKGSFLIGVEPNGTQVDPSIILSGTEPFPLPHGLGYTIIGGPETSNVSYLVAKVELTLNGVAQGVYWLELAVLQQQGQVYVVSYTPFELQVT
jgi:hypothetical protein